MKQFDVIIIGGGPAGVACAISAANTYPGKKIGLVRKEEKPMIPCGIPYILNSLNNVDENILPDTPLKKNNIEIIIDEVTGKSGNMVELKSGEQIEFEKLVIATGSRAIKPPIEGSDLDGVYMVKKNRDYLVELRDRVQSVNSIVILGGGYIGVEVADELLKAGKQITIVEKLEHLLPVAMDSEFGDYAQSIIEEKGGRIILGKSISSIRGNGKVEKVCMDDGTEVEAELVILGCGYAPNLDIAEKLNLVYDPKQGIMVDQYLRTSDKNIFAIGDCAAKLDFFTGDFSNVMLASTAVAEGRLVGSNLFSIKVIRKYKGVMGSFATKIGETAFGVSGLTEKKAEELGIEIVIGRSDAVNRHPGKLPGAAKVHMKLIFSRYSHDLLGGQVYGGESTGEVINMLSVLILNKMTDMEIDTLQIGTHPLLTASPVVYPLLTATTDAIKKYYVPQSN